MTDKFTINKFNQSWIEANGTIVFYAVSPEHAARICAEFNAIVERERKATGWNH